MTPGIRNHLAGRLSRRRSADAPTASRPSPIANPDYDRVYHFHVRKTAGTSLNAAFWALGGLDLAAMAKSTEISGNGLRYVRNNPGLIARGDYFFANSHAPAHRVSLPPRTFTVTILRDPVARVVSYYRYLLWSTSGKATKKVDPAIKSVRDEAAAVLGSSFRDFLERAPEQDLLTQLHLFSKHLDPAEAAERVLRCDAVFFTETFAADLRNLEAMLGLALIEGNERRVGETVALAPEDRAVLRERLEPEYEMFARVHAGLAASS